ncbi:MAG: DUF308 domain-containing protein [Clostridia bacterium]|nr:DUF308 domain-containing protein [Clostridia bacterium]
MRSLTILVGIILVGVGVFSVAEYGAGFLAIAFVVGIALMLTGLVLCFSYRKLNQDKEEAVHWVLIEGLTSFLLGLIVFTGYINADIAVSSVFGFWIMITGIRAVVIAYDSFQHETFKFNVGFVLGTVNLIVGILVFFNNALFTVSVLMLVGACLILQGLNVIKIGSEITYKKPDIIKTKEELVQEAQEEVLAKKAEMHESIQAAREAKQALAEAQEATTAEEILGLVDQQTEH